MLPSLSAWLKVFERFDESRDEKYICSVLKEKCLISNKLFKGKYLIDSEKVWNALVESNEQLKERLFLTGITDFERLEWFYYDKVETYNEDDDDYEYI